MKNIKIKLFGPFRKYVECGEMSIELPNEINVKKFKDLLCIELKKINNDFNDHQLIRDSAVATEARILTLEENVSGSVLAVLPPVCGG